MFKRVLIANRGEIAVRIISTLKKTGIGSVALYTLPDEGSLHTRMADECFLLRGDTLSETYLNQDEIIRIALHCGADAIHPGYGFLSENADFAEAVVKAGLTFIGPSPELIRLMGDKVAARKSVFGMGLPIIPGIEGNPESLLALLGKGDSGMFPVMIKAAAGGGGKAMRRVNDIPELEEGLVIASREAMNYFGNGELCVEKYFENARHIEVQVLADKYGNILIPGERDCTVQRRFQKVIEEAPSLFLKENTRTKLFDASRRIVEELGYENAGTIEFLVDHNQDFYFLEMNTRIQVEHPVTEMITGLDLVHLQIMIAAGDQIPGAGGVIVPEGHAIEARLYAENPDEGFLPAPGRIHAYSEPSFPGIRIDSGIDGPSTLHPEYDPMIAKIIAHGRSRQEAIETLKSALGEFVISGTLNNRLFLKEILDDPDFLSNTLTTGWLEASRDRLVRNLSEKAGRRAKTDILALWLTKALHTAPQGSASGIWHEIGYWRQIICKSVVFDGRQFDLFVDSFQPEFLFIRIWQ